MPTIPIVTPTFPDFVGSSTRKFGVVGVKSLTDEGYKFEHESTGATVDNLLTYLDILMIDNYFYVIANSGTAELTLQEMQSAGFESRMFPEAEPDPEVDNKVRVIIGENEYIYNYDATWLDLEYNSRETYTDDPFKVVTVYDMLIMELCSRVDALLFGDINVDAFFDNSDYTLLTTMLNTATTRNTQLAYLYAQHHSSDDVITSVTKTYQSIVQGPMYNVGEFTSFDTTVYEKALDNIFGITTFPKDNFILPNTGTSAVFTVVCGNPATYDVYHYEWLLENSSGEMEQQQIGESNTFTIISPDVSLDNRCVQVNIYDQIQETVPPDTDYTDTDYFRSRSYTAQLYVSTPTLWGDINGDGVVNVLDAYRVVNNFDYKKGDCNKDGLINSTDASLVLHWYSLLVTGHTEKEALDILSNNTTKCFTISDFYRCDLNEDNYVNNVDASLIQRCYSLLSQGKTEAQIKTATGVTLSTISYTPKIVGELAALVKETRAGTRPTTITKDRGILILESIKNNNVKLY